MTQPQPLCFLSLVPENINIIHYMMNGANGGEFGEYNILRRTARKYALVDKDFNLM